MIPFDAFYSKLLGTFESFNDKFYIEFKGSLSERPEIFLEGWEQYQEYLFKIIDDNNEDFDSLKPTDYLKKSVCYFLLAILCKMDLEYPEYDK